MNRVHLVLIVQADLLLGLFLVNFERLLFQMLLAVMTNLVKEITIFKWPRIFNRRISRQTAIH